MQNLARRCRDSVSVVLFVETLEGRFNPHSMLNSDPLHVLQVHPLQREAVQMSGVREGLLSVQDSGRPQDVTHAGEGTEAQQGQIIQLHRRRVIGRTGTLENHEQRQLQSQYNFFCLSFFISAVGGGAPRPHWEYFLHEETFPSLAQRITARPALSSKTLYDSMQECLCPQT